MGKPKKYNNYPDFYPVEKESEIYANELQELLGAIFKKIIDCFPGGIIFNIYSYGNGYSMQVSYKGSNENLNIIDNLACFLTNIYWQNKCGFIQY
ncbi:hypothetical protein [Aquimarina algiphila]|uniref:hypothetical protein n=1 Tax=Aquimarina algiphila TaxID=2047982 RepID=UPI0023304D32|nr:hypothetical protein [Aquimarina algiphila]